MNHTEFGYFDDKGQYNKTFALNLQNIPSSDPLAFAYGLHTGQMYLKETQEKKVMHVRINHGSPHRELAQEYLRGFLLGYRGILVPEGTKIRKGEEQSFFHFDKDIWKDKSKNPF